MNGLFTTKALGELATFPFKDPHWQKKLLIACGLQLAGMFTFFITCIFVVGYQMRLIRRIAVEDGEAALPEWEDWGGLFKDGLRLLVVQFVILLPVLLLYFLFIGLTFLPFLAVLFMGEQNSDPIILFSMMGFLLGMILMGVIIILSFGVGMIQPVIQVHISVQHSVAAVLHVREWWPIFRAGLGNFVLAYLLLMAVSYAFSTAMQILMITVVFIVVMPFVIIVAGQFLNLFVAALYARIYRTAAEKIKPAA